MNFDITNCMNFTIYQCSNLNNWGTTYSSSINLTICRNNTDNTIFGQVYVVVRLVYTFRLQVNTSELECVSIEAELIHLLPVTIVIIEHTIDVVVQIDGVVQ